MTPAKAILAWCLANDLEVESVDPDAEGGTAIYLNGVNGASACIWARESGKHEIVLTQHEYSTIFIFSLHSLEMTRKFLKEAIA